MHEMGQSYNNLMSSLAAKIHEKMIYDRKTTRSVIDCGFQVEILTRQPELAHTLFSCEDVSRIVIRPNQVHALFPAFDTTERSMKLDRFLLLKSLIKSASTELSKDSS